MATSRQLGLGPMPLQEVATTVASVGKKVVPLVDLLVRAFVRCGRNAQQAAGELGMSPSQFSKAMSIHWPEQNPVMKKFDAVDYEVRREFAALLAAEYGIGQNDTAQVQTLLDFARLLKAVNE